LGGPPRRGDLRLARPHITRTRSLGRERTDRTLGLAGLDLGEFGGTGAGLDDAASAALTLPEVDKISEYLAGAFQALESALARIDDDAILERTVVDLYGDETTIGEVLMNHLSHADRHLGMIEALRGVLGERGTATV
jgi:hypothetical protein